MKRTTTIIMIAAVVSCLMSGCKLKTYYQVYQTTPNNAETCQQREGVIVHEGNDYTITYNFFAEEGHGGFWFTNNTDSVIFINLAESFFIQNGTANDYFQARRWTTTNSQTLQSSTQSGKRKTQQALHSHYTGHQPDLNTRPGLR